MKDFLLKSEVSDDIFGALDMTLSATLIYPGGFKVDMDHTGVLIAQLLRLYGLQLQQHVSTSHSQVQIDCRDCIVLIDLFTNTDDGSGEPGTHLSIRMIPDGTADAGMFEAALAGTVRGILQASPATSVQWLTTDITLDSADFMAALGPILPRRVLRDVHDPTMTHSRRPAPLQIRPARTEPSPEQMLSDAIRREPDQDALIAEFGEILPNSDSDLERLGAWAITGVLAFVAMPLAVTLTAINLTKGENLRMACHAAGVVALLVALKGDGAWAQVLTALPH